MSDELRERFAEVLEENRKLKATNELMSAALWVTGSFVFAIMVVIVFKVEIAT